MKERYVIIMENIKKLIKSYVKCAETEYNLAGINPIFDEGNKHISYLTKKVIESDEVPPEYKERPLKFIREVIHGKI